MLGFAAYVFRLRQRIARAWLAVGTREAMAWSSCVMATFAANMVFIDVHLTYKTMAFLFLVLGSLSENGSQMTGRTPRLRIPARSSAAQAATA